MMRFLKKMKYPGSWSLFRSDDRLLLMIFAIIVGICSGLAALLLNRGLETMLEWLHHYRTYWWAIFLPAAGAALSSLFLEKIVNEGWPATVSLKSFMPSPDMAACCACAPVFPV